MTTRLTKNRLSPLVGSAAAALLLAGCASSGMAVRANSADRAQAALAKGSTDKAIAHAEAAVAASPRDAALRVLLGQAYFKSGRFQSAAATYDDAMELGDNSARTALSLALAKVGAGDSAGAIAVLDDWRAEIPASDLGLALALAGEPERGVAVLSDALRGGENTPKIRQNLAYAYAMAGRWREARVMAAQDVAGDALGDRMTEWASTIQPEQSRERVAAVLGVKMRADPGQPAALALSNNPQAEQLAAETTANPAAPVIPAVRQDPVVVAINGELPASDGSAAPAPAAAPAPVEAAPAPLAYAEPAAAPAPVAAGGTTFISQPVIQTVMARPAKMAARAPVKAVPTTAAGTHLVQLGSFSSPQGARRAWGIYSARNAALSAYRMTITPAVVRGKNVWRVAAAGINGSGAARGLCSSVKNRGGACFAYSAPIRAKVQGAPAREQRDLSGPQMARRR